MFEIKFRLPGNVDDFFDEELLDAIFSQYDEDESFMPEITKVTFNDPATVVFWSDGSKTVVKCQKDKGDTYSEEVGLAMAIAKKAYGNKGCFNDVINKWLNRV